MSATWVLKECASGCWVSEYQYEGPGSTQSGHEFMIHATLEPGAEQYFSGIRIIIGCKDGEEGELADLAIKDNVGSTSLPKIRNTKREDEEKSRMLLVQQDGCRLAERWQESDAPLPLCTLVFEIVDKSNPTFSRVNLLLHPLGAIEPQSLHTLYNYIKPYAPTSNSLLLFLSINHTFRGSLKPNNPSGMACAYPAPTGILAHGAYILPPAAVRKPFTQLPPELLHIIFEKAVADKYSNWRAMLISFALVCHAWSPALDHLFKDFGTYSAGRNRPNAIRLAKAIEMNPKLGQKIRTFNPNHFSTSKDNSEERYLEFSTAINTILHRATSITNLQLVGTYRQVAQDFVRALCRSPDVKHFLVNRGPLMTEQSDYRYVLTMADILRCMTYWPRLQKIGLSGFATSDEGDGLPVPACSITELLLQHGRLTSPQLRKLTSLSHYTLQHATLQQISGLTNEDLYTWLNEVGPMLRTLCIKLSGMSRRSDDEEYAIDAVLPKMTNLSRLDLEGDIVSELVFIRYAPRRTENSFWHYGMYSISIDNAPGVNAHGFVGALRTTKWTQVSMRALVLREENTELREEAKKIARDRKILLMV